MNDSWVMIILFALIFGFGNGGILGGRQDFGQFATAASQSEILLGQQFQGLDNKIDRIGNGIADATFALNNSITGEGRGIQMQLAQMNAGLSAAIHCEGETTRALINAQETQRLRDELYAARNANSQFAQNNYLLGVMGKWVANPTATA